jgi:hypothetical protein
MDICGETLIGFVCTHCDAIEFLKLAEEVLDPVASLVDLNVDRQGRCARGCCEMTILGRAR